MGFSKFIAISRSIWVLFLAMAMNFSSHGQQLTCSPAPDCIIRSELFGADIPSGDMYPWGNVAIAGWDIAHGSPTVMAGQGVWMWSYSGATRGEGIYTCYNFKKDHTYRVCIEVKCGSLPGTLGYEKGYFFMEATNGNFNRPVPVANQLIAAWRMTEQDFTRFTYTFTANRNYSRLWLFPYMAEPPDGKDSQYEAIVRSVRVQEVQFEPITSVSSDTIRIINSPNLSGHWSWTHDSLITAANADSSVIKVNVCERTLFKGIYRTDCGICDTYSVNAEAEGIIPQISISGDKEICQQEPFFLTATGADTYLWQPGNISASTMMEIADTSITYTISGFKGACITVVEYPLVVHPVWSKQNDITICAGEKYRLPDNRLVEKEDTYLSRLKTSKGCDSIITTYVKVKPSYTGWLDITLQDGSSYTLPDGNTLDSTGTYTYVTQAANGCDSMIIIHLKRTIFIPNLITPNGDNRNDSFEVKGLPHNAEVKIYNQWGSLVYHHSSYKNSWSGEEGRSGIYYYEIQLPDDRHYSGWIQVQRE